MEILTINGNIYHYHTLRPFKITLNVRPESIKILEENTGSKISDIACSNIYLIDLPRQRNKRKNKQMGL